MSRDPSVRRSPGFCHIRPPQELPAAKTNHLPKIQGRRSLKPLHDASRNQNTSSYLMDSAPLRNEPGATFSGTSKSAFRRVVSGAYSRRSIESNFQSRMLFSDRTPHAMLRAAFTELFSFSSGH